MSKYLIQTTEVYRADTENEANQIIESAKHCKDWELAKYDCTARELKAKGDVVDTWFKVSLQKVFTKEKEPDVQYDVYYSTKESLIRGEEVNATF